MYFTDGAASQYKNKSNFINLSHHFKDFEIKAEWHFFATSHGKSPCDGVAGAVKRGANRASLQKTINDQLLTAQDVYQWAVNAMKGITFIYTTIAEHEDHIELLKPRCEKAKALPGTRSFHCFVPVNKKQISCKIVSESKSSKNLVVVKSQEELEKKKVEKSAKRIE